MHSFRQFLVFLAFLAGLAVVPARAETFHTCGTIIPSLPTVITTSGVYCLTKDLSTAMSAGIAVTVNANNVTLDCNGYKLGGLAAGASSTTTGIYADGTRQNITVRNCGIRGFYFGIDLQGGAGHLVEDNRLDNNLYYGIVVIGDNNRVRRNAVYDTGGSSLNTTYSYAIYAAADVIDNTVAGVFANGTNTFPSGITMNASSTEARGNQVRGLTVAGSGSAIGIAVQNAAHGVTVDGNRISAAAAMNGTAIYGIGLTDTICIGNAMLKYGNSMVACQDGGGNVSN